jgi:hypothetical protein
MEMYEWLNKEFNFLTEEIEKVQEQRATNQQKRNALVRKYQETKVIDNAEKQKVVEETEMLSNKSKDLFHKRKAVNEMLKIYYSENR